MLSYILSYRRRGLSKGFVSDRNNPSVDEAGTFHVQFDSTACNTRGHQIYNIHTVYILFVCYISTQLYTARKRNVIVFFLVSHFSPSFSYNAIQYKAGDVYTVYIYI